MRLAVIGIGHVGLVTAGCLARWGHEVVGMDDDPAKVELLRRGSLPFHEPGLAELIGEEVAAGRLRFTNGLGDALAEATGAFVCVGTPPMPGGGPDLSYVEAVGRNVAEHVSGPLVLIEKSTVPTSTGVRLKRVIEREQRRNGNHAVIHVASNPEFLREGSAVADTLHPDRIVYGTDSDAAREMLRAIYRDVVEREGCPVLETDVATAELIKHASNAFLAMRISFINAIAQICERVDADVEQVAAGMGYDHRIGREFLKAGLGYGGSCFPKDVDALVHLAASVGYDFRLLDEVRRINEDQRESILDKLRHELWHLEEKTVAVLGAAFKPGTDDLRESPALYLASALLAEGARVRIWDPVALHEVKEMLPEAVVVEDPLEACRDAHAAVVATEWSDLARLTPGDLRDALAYPIVVDGRNVFDPDLMYGAGIRYLPVGRGRISR